MNAKQTGIRFTGKFNAPEIEQKTYEMFNENKLNNTYLEWNHEHELGIAASKS